MKSSVLILVLSLVASITPAHAAPSSSDLFDVNQGGAASASNLLCGFGGNVIGGTFGNGGPPCQFEPNSDIIFNENQAVNTVDITLNNPVTAGYFEIYGHGDRLNDEFRDMSRFRLLYSNDGIDYVEAFDSGILVSTLDAEGLLLSGSFAPVTATLFRAEFTNADSAGGARVEELDVYETSPVPEPASIAITSAGLAACYFLRLRRRS